MNLSPALPNNAPRFLINLALVASVIVCSYLLGREQLGIILLLPIAATLGSLILLRRIELGVLALSLTAFAIPFSLRAGNQSAIVASIMVAALAIGAWLYSLLIRKDLRFKLSLVDVSLLAFAAANVWSYLWSNAFLNPRVEVWAGFPMTQLGALGVTLISIGAFLLAAHVITDPRWTKALVVLFILLGALSALVAFRFIRLPVKLETGGLVPMWIISLAYAQALFNRKLPKRLRVLLLLLAVAWIFRLSVTGVGWISGWLPALVAVAAISFFRSKRLFVVLVVLGSLFVFSRWDYHYHQIVTVSAAQGDFQRLSAWSANWSVTKEHLMFGTGPAGYALYYMTFFPHQAMATHNNYVDILAQTGLVGTGAFLLFLFAVGRSGLGLWRRMPDDSLAGFSAAAMGGFFGLLVSMALGDWFIPFVYTQTIAGFNYTVHSWIFLGLMVGLKRLALPDQAGIGKSENDAQGMPT